MYKTIMVYLDNPRVAETTLQHVEELANHFDSNVILTQVVVPQPTYYGGWAGAIAEDDTAMMDAETMLSPWRGKLAEHGIGARVSVLPGYDSIAETIVAHARAHRIDLIVLPSQLNHDLLGWSAEGVTEAIIRSAPCPVLIAPETEDEVWS